eukprot:TRINITY_DN8100_c0_g3_i1.p1 TRINITY_DN8100_c0_g3~~TRINITY_DN8100_c0_g3_i1.p1  ORF type:complete len:345 (+),score=69.88 TRINITY_DN8100_c0_g3_i1:56-1036(+)
MAHSSHWEAALSAMANSTDCDAPGSGAATNWVMGLVGLGTFLSFTPTWFTMIQTQSNTGISVTAMMILNLNNLTATLGLLFLNWRSLQCCRDEWGFVDCLVGVNPILLIGAGLLGSFPLYALAVWYRDCPEGNYTRLPNEDTSAAANEEGSPTMSFASKASQASIVSIHQEAKATSFTPTSRASAIAGMVGFALFAVVDLVCGLLLVVYGGADSGSLNTFGRANNIAAAVFMSSCWFPQIYHTYHLKAAGNLSIVMLLIQAPGSAIVVISLLLDHQDFTTVASNAVSLVAQSVLLVMCISYERARAKSEAAAEDIRDDTAKIEKDA